MGDDAVGQLPVQRVLYENQQFPVFRFGLLAFLFFFLRFEAQIVRIHGAEALFCVRAQHIHQELVDVVGKKENVVPLFPDPLCLRQFRKGSHRLAGSIVDHLLPFGHGFDVLFQCDGRVLLRTVEHQQILQLFLVGTVGIQESVFELQAERLVEFVIGRPVVVDDFQQFVPDLLLDAVGDDLQLTIVLQHLAGDVQAQIRGLHHAAHKAEMIRQQSVAVLHDHHSGRVQLEARLIILRVIIRRCGRGYEQHGLITDSTFRTDADHGRGILEIVKVFLVEGFAVIVGDLALRALPDGHPAVDHFVLGVILPVLLGGAVLLLLSGLRVTAARHVHVNGPPDVIGVLFHDAAQGVVVQVFGIRDLVGILFQRHDDVGSPGVPFTGFHRIAVRSRRLPYARFIGTVGAAHDRYFGRNHESRIKTHTELADDVQFFFDGVAVFVSELECAAFCDHAQVLLHLLRRHADAVV